MADAIELGLETGAVAFQLVEGQGQEGRFIIYAAKFDTMDALLGFLTQNCCGGNPCSPLGVQACEPGTSSCAA